MVTSKFYPHYKNYAREYIKTHYIIYYCKLILKIDPIGMPPYHHSTALCVDPCLALPTTSVIISPMGNTEIKFQYV